MDGIVIEVGKIFPPPCLPQQKVQLGLEVFKTFVVSDTVNFLPKSLSSHFMRASKKSLMFMHMVIVLCARELLQ